MGLAETADLAIRLNLTGNAKSGIKGIQTDLGKLGKSAGQTVATTTRNLAKVGVVAAGFIGAGVKAGLNSLAELENATTSVDGAIKQVGLTGKLTSQQVAAWAQEIETSVHSAFDDKAITQAATTLIRYGKVSEKNLKPALVVMTDLAAKTGSVESASSLLAKALADPAKAAGKLARVGIILTDQQQKQIKKMTEAGDVVGAQTVLLDALAKSTKGAADASQGPYQRSLSVLKDVTEDAERALATGFLPVIEEVRDILSKELAKPQTLTNIKKFGETLAGGLRSLIGIAKNLPWEQIGDSLKVAGTGAKAVLDAFAGLPPWIQTAVLTGWGLNKVTGGALTGAIGKGLEVSLKGVFGQFFQRGSSPANPLFVSAVGGLGGGAPGAAAGGAGLGLAGTAAATVGVTAVVALAANDTSVIADAVGKGYQAYQQKDVQGLLAANREIATGVLAIPQPLRDLIGGVMDSLVPAVQTGTAASERGLDQIAKATSDAKSADARESRVLQNKTQMVASALDRTKATLAAKMTRVDSSIRAIPPAQQSVKVATNVKVSVTANSVTRSITQSSLYTANHLGALTKAGNLL